MGDLSRGLIGIVGPTSQGVNSFYIEYYNPYLVYRTWFKIPRKTSVLT
jgi:hypothetical protein